MLKDFFLYLKVSWTITVTITSFVGIEVTQLVEVFANPDIHMIEGEK